MHSVTAFWLSLFIVIQLFSGLMWTDVWGGMANRFVAFTGSDGPVGDQPWEAFAFPKSTIPTKDVAHVPWAAENLPVPKSSTNGVPSLSVENVIEIVKNNHVDSDYKIAFPKDKTGVFTVYLDPADVYPNRPMPWTQQTLHIDQYTGKVLANFGWKDYGILGKIVSLGIAFHQGEFGLLSQIFMLFLMFGIIMIAVTGYVMWWKRRPKGKLGAPALPEDFKMLKGVAVIVLVLSFSSLWWVFLF
ncbi:PepSY domain-containing protein [Bacillus sp. EB600]|uniref:PepSY-associated TM helix domain-containing protein n=1 Tax=Bacillus sp. EB600 TaxID=2806345 RepID=UPI00210D3D06|nr:PepSY domain-containing protein [Bacillus sp. EB600]